MKVLSKLSEVSKFFGLSDEDEAMVEQETSFVKKEVESPSSSKKQPIASTSSDGKNIANQHYMQKEEKIVSLDTSRKTQANIGNERMKSSRTQKTEKQNHTIFVSEPRTYSEAREIAKNLFRDEIVIVNFHLIEEYQARRIVDFLTGVVYALDGDIQRIGDEMFLCTPPHTEIDSSTAKDLVSTTQFAEY